MRTPIHGAELTPVDFISPREACGLVMQATGASRAQAIDVICNRLMAGMVISVVGRLAGHSVPGSLLQPSFQLQIIPHEMWDSAIFCAPESSVWTTGDVSAAVPAGPIHFFNIRFTRKDVMLMIDDFGGTAQNDNRASFKAADPLAGQLVSTQPSNVQLKEWARSYHSECERSNRSKDWARAGQAALESAFPGAQFKRGEALAIAKELNLTRTYRR